ncbi:Spy/CpxP family protein refolding chaperone [Acidovorax sp. M2(2025)]|uniref:Spy/CpxP family protein refolding chaperone n=1 Tax=Acidovorax sp. M2(2025) TaxID=3411355 RepID=UPI003BF559DF
MVSTFQRRLAATAVLAALALPVLAQPQPPAAPAPNAGASGAPGRFKGGDPEQRLARHQAHMAQRLAALKDQLKLTPAQESAWTAYTAALQPGARPARLDRSEMEKLSTPERIDRMRALRAQHAAEADRRGEATKTFYAALTPEQQKVFDTQTRHDHPRMGGMRGEGPGHHGRHGAGPQGPRGPAAAGTAAPAAPAK